MNRENLSLNPKLLCVLNWYLTEACKISALSGDESNSYLSLRPYLYQCFANYSKIDRLEFKDFMIFAKPSLVPLTDRGFNEPHRLLAWDNFKSCLVHSVSLTQGDLKKYKMQTESFRMGAITNFKESSFYVGKYNIFVNN